MRLIAWGVVALALVLTGCTAQGTGAATPTAAGPTEPPASAAPAQDPLDLIGLWRVTGAEGEEADTWLRIDALEMQLWRDCGVVFWHWAALPGALTTSISASGGCGVGGVMPEAPWLASAVAFERTEDGWLLRDADGAVGALLSIDGAPQPIPGTDEMLTRPPTVDAGARAHFRPPADMPAALTPATPDELAGRWIPLGFETADDETRPFVEFDASGRYDASDGCNGAMGGWLLAADGRFAATVANTTDIGCDGADVPGWVSGARRAGLDGAELVLLDADATELGRLTQG